MIKIIRGIDSVLLFSENARKLAEFYRDVVGLKTVSEWEMGKKGEAVFDFEIKQGGGFSIIDHSDIKGKAKEPKRVIINFEVDDEEKQVNRLKKDGVKLIKDIYHVEGYGLIATFEDPDGNYFQLVQVRSS